MQVLIVVSNFQEMFPQPPWVCTDSTFDVTLNGLISQVGE